MRNRILVDMNFHRETVRHHEDICYEYDRERYKIAGKDRWDPFKNEPIRDAGALSQIRKTSMKGSSSNGEYLQKVRELTV